MSFNLHPVYGGMMFGTNRGEWTSDENVEKGLAILKEYGVKTIDTAQLYGNGASESCLGRVGAPQDFIIDTKWIGGWADSAWASAKNIVESTQQSLERLHTTQVDVFYMHSPDNQTPYEETLKGIDQAYRNGWLKRFGLSNYSVKETRKVLEICKSNGYVMPTVYQGSYSAALRKVEDELLPLLREHKIAFYAYSPIAGGFLTKSRQYVTEGQGRFNKNASYGLYHNQFNRDSYMNFLDEWNTIAEDEGVSKPELAFRWINHHSMLKPEYGDAIIFGASTLEQTKQTCEYLQAGALKDQAVKRIDDLWTTVRDDALLDSWIAAGRS